MAFNVAGRNALRNAAYYIAGYCYYLSGAVAPRRVLYGQVGYAVRLYNHAMRGAAIEGIADRVLTGQTDPEQRMLNFLRDWLDRMDQARQPDFDEPVEFDPANREILSMILFGGESLEWGKPID